MFFMLFMVRSGRRVTLFIEEPRLFEALCTVEVLEAGFRRVKKNKGSPGVDGVTIDDFGSRLSEELSRLKEELESWIYKPLRYAGYKLLL